MCLDLSSGARAGPRARTGPGAGQDRAGPRARQGTTAGPGPGPGLGPVPGYLDMLFCLHYFRWNFTDMASPAEITITTRTWLVWYLNGKRRGGGGEGGGEAAEEKEVDEEKDLTHPV